MTAQTVDTVELDDLATLVGRDLGTSDWRRVSQNDIDAFAQITGDDQWIHVDVERASREIGGTVAHGFLTLSLLSAMALQSSVRIVGARRRVNYGFDKLRFTSFVASGAEVRLRQVVTSVESKGEGVALMRHCEVDIKGQAKPALVCDWITVFYR